MSAPMDASSPARPAASSERRPLTVLFADIAGSTAIAEALDPEDWTSIVGEAFQCMNRTVEGYGGKVARLMGDGLLAFFGAPVAHEDDPERAVRCGLEMVRAIETLGTDKRLPVADGLKVRVGINTGPVVVGVVGTDTANEYTAMGDTVNVAARMQAAARPGGVLITSSTHRFVAPLVDAVDVGRLELKGKTDAVQAYEISGLKAGAVRTRGIVGVRSPIVGRDQELTRMLEAFNVARAGQGRMACVLGDPGIGKSRLVSEFRETSERAGSGTRWVEGRCLTYGESMPYHLVVDLVRSMIGVTAATEEAEIAAKLEAAVRDLVVGDWQETYAYLGHLLSLHLSEDFRSRVSMVEGETVKRYVASVSLMVRGLNARGPVVLFCDDIHWADPASVTTLLQLLHSVPGQNLFVIVGSRVERSAPGWRLVVEGRELFGDAFVELRLGPLSDESSRTLVSNLLKIESLPEETRELILQKAEGNPFFVEEVIRMLIDRGAIVREEDRWIATERVIGIEIPDTLHGLLLARIDKLPVESKRTLRVASVIGRQFGVTILERLLEKKT